MWGGPEFFGVVKGGDQNFFSGSKGGGPKFFEGQGGGTKIFSQIFFFAPSAQFLLRYIIQKFFAPSAQPFPLPYFMPHNMFIYNQIFSQPPAHSLFSLITAPPLFVRGGCSFTLGGDQNFSQGQRGGAKFFPVGKVGDQIFFTYANGGTRKNWRPAITNRRPPLPVKNDSSLIQ